MSNRDNGEARRLVVFLPYKASMWDSMESVWKASAEDAEWESVVMPIPYFSKNSDGSIIQMEYEGAEFPQEVPIVDWQTFSLEQEQPDIIVIHNPYDQYNRVTTVHPDFYAKELRNNTKNLVYIPYFVHQKDRVAEHYCVLPGTMYANTVVLQSEKVRKQYMNYYEQAFAQLVQKRGNDFITAKFKAWGSPKLDWRSDSHIEIPKEWETLLQNDRKVVFFNTHITCLMQENSAAFLKKLENVLLYFKKRNDMVLLWRPHPLMLQTAQAMNPEAVAPYLELLEWYRKEGFGIYDDSKDFHRAVCLSDLCYGSGSSVTELFQQQGKPVQLMHMDQMDEAVDVMLPSTIPHKNTGNGAYIWSQLRR